MNLEIASRLGNNELIRWVLPYQPLLATLVTLLRSYSLYPTPEMNFQKYDMILTQFPFDAHFNEEGRLTTLEYGKTISQPCHT